MAKGKHQGYIPNPEVKLFRTMVLHRGRCGRVGHRRTICYSKGPSFRGGPFCVHHPFSLAPGDPFGPRETGEPCPGGLSPQGGALVFRMTRFCRHDVNSKTTTDHSSPQTGARAGPGSGPAGSDRIGSAGRDHSDAAAGSSPACFPVPDLTRPGLASPGPGSQATSPGRGEALAVRRGHFFVGAGPVSPIPPGRLGFRVRGRCLGAFPRTRPQPAWPVAAVPLSGPRSGQRPKSLRFRQGPFPVSRASQSRPTVGSVRLTRGIP